MNQITDLAPLAMLTNLEHLDLPVQTPGIADITALQALTALRVLNLSSNQNIADLTPLAGLIALENLNLDNNSIEDIAALVSNSGMGTGDEIRLQYNPLSQSARCDQIAALETRGANVLPASARQCGDATPIFVLRRRGRRA
ncbi:MAG: leucine-rich repeat domain-containing protein [Candidatus Hydrogenedentota bacterium]